MVIARWRPRRSGRRAEVALEQPAPRSPATPARGSRPAARGSVPSAGRRGRQRPSVRCGRNGRSSTGRPEAARRRRRAGRPGRPAAPTSPSSPAQNTCGRRTDPNRPAPASRRVIAGAAATAVADRGDQRRHAVRGHGAEEEQGEVPAVRRASSAARPARPAAGPAPGRGGPAPRPAGRRRRRAGGSRRSPSSPAGPPARPAAAAARSRGPVPRRRPRRSFGTSSSSAASTSTSVVGRGQQRRRRAIARPRRDEGHLAAEPADVGGDHLQRPAPAVRIAAAAGAAPTRRWTTRAGRPGPGDEGARPTATGAADLQQWI